VLAMSPHEMWYDWSGLNSQIFLIVNGARLPEFDAFMLGLSMLSHPALYPVYVAIALCWSRARPASLPISNVVVFTIGYVLTSMLIVPALKVGFDFPRPAQVLGEAAVRIIGMSDLNHSFPSGHAAFAVLMAASLMPRIASGAQLALIVFAALACVSRIWVGAHYPADVLAGALIALVIVSLVRFAVM